MIIVKFESKENEKWIKTFGDENCFDDFLNYYFNNDKIDNYDVLFGHSIITGEIKQKGINNK